MIGLQELGGVGLVREVRRFNRASDSAFSGKPIFFENVIVLNGQAASPVLLAGEEFPRSEPSDHLSWAAYCALACCNLARRSIDCNKTPRLSLIGTQEVNSGTDTARRNVLRIQSIVSGASDCATAERLIVIKIINNTGRVRRPVHLRTLQDWRRAADRLEEKASFHLILESN